MGSHFNYQLSDADRDGLRNLIRSVEAKLDGTLGKKQRVLALHAVMRGIVAEQVRAITNT